MLSAFFTPEFDAMMRGRDPALERSVEREIWSAERMAAMQWALEWRCDLRGIRCVYCGAVIRGRANIGGYSFYGQGGHSITPRGTCLDCADFMSAGADE